MMPRNAGRFGNGGEKFRKSETVHRRQNDQESHRRAEENGEFDCGLKNFNCRKINLRPTKRLLTSN
jgi:hypothetical protein